MKRMYAIEAADRCAAELIEKGHDLIGARPADGEPGRASRLSAAEALVRGQVPAEMMPLVTWSAAGSGMVGVDVQAPRCEVIVGVFQLVGLAKWEFGGWSVTAWSAGAGGGMGGECRRTPDLAVALAWADTSYHARAEHEAGRLPATREGTANRGR